MKKQFFSTLLFIISTFLIFGYTYYYPTKNGSSPGCTGGGCHSFKDGLVSVKLLDSVRVEVTVSGVSSGKAIAGELVNSSGKVVDYINSTKTNPFILTATEEGAYRINAGFKSPSKLWDSASVVIQNSIDAEPDSGWQSDLLITEIMFDVPKDNAGDANGDGVRGSHSDEFVEIYNRGDSTINIGGFQLLERNSIPVFTFPNGATINPGQFAVVFGAVGSAGFGTVIPSNTLLYSVHPNDNNNDGFDNGNGKSNFSNSGDCVILVNPAKNDTLAEIYWGSAAPVTSKPVFLGFPNTISGSKISGAIRQSVTRHINSLIWDMHTTVSGDATFLYSPGTDAKRITDVREKDNLCSGFKLYQNYPNPFNPKTIIKYSISSLSARPSSLVKLFVFDELGQKVATLVNEHKAPGNYEVQFDASGLPSGIYFYRLIVGNSSDTKTSILLK